MPARFITLTISALFILGLFAACTGESDAGDDADAGAGTTEETTDADAGSSDEGTGTEETADEGSTEDDTTGDGY